MRPSVVLRGVEDEASLAISLAAATGRFWQFARDVTHRLWHGAWHGVWLTGLVLLGLLWIALTFSGPMPTGAMRAVGFIAALVAVAPPLLLGGLSAVARALTGFAAGRELALLPNLEVSVSTAPDCMAIPRLIGNRGVTITTLSRRGRSLPHLRHSIYDDPDVFSPIALWLGDAFGQTILDTHSGRQTSAPRALPDASTGQYQGRAGPQ